MIHVAFDFSNSFEVTYETIKQANIIQLAGDLQ